MWTAISVALVCLAVSYIATLAYRFQWSRLPMARLADLEAQNEARNLQMTTLTTRVDRHETSLAEAVADVRETHSRLLQSGGITVKRS